MEPTDAGTSCGGLGRIERDDMRSPLEKLKKNRENVVYDDSPARIFERKLVAETPEFRFYLNWVSEGIEDMLHKMDSDGLCFTGYCALLSEDKEDGHTEYIIFNDKGVPFMSANDIDDAEFKIVTMKLKLKENLDIRRMAETGVVPKVV